MFPQEARDQALQQQQMSPRTRKSSAASLLCARKTNKRKRHGSPLKLRGGGEAAPYEEMSLYYPQSSQRRPLVLVGPPSIGRHELRQRLLDDTARFAAPIPREYSFMSTLVNMRN